jgi:hypothetical protein
VTTHGLLGVSAPRTTRYVRPIERITPEKSGKAVEVDSSTRVDDGNSASGSMASFRTAYQAQIFNGAGEGIRHGILVTGL